MGGADKFENNDGTQNSRRRGRRSKFTITVDTKLESRRVPACLFLTVGCLDKFVTPADMGRFLAKISFEILPKISVY